MVITVGSFFPNDIGKPLIGEVVNPATGGTCVTLKWWEGTYSGTWKPSKRRVSKQFVDWTEEVEPAKIILSGFYLKAKQGKRPRVPPSLKLKIRAALANLK